MKHDMTMKTLLTRVARCGLLLALLPLAAQAQVTVSDTLTGASSTYSWKALNGACMTAGTTATTTGTVPACKGLAYYSGQTLVGGTTGTLPDAVGSGALRLTNGGSGGTYAKGSVVSTVPFATSQGVQVTFTTVTYGGNNSNGTGADGITFFLLDGTQDQTALTLGGSGGSLGYSCSNGNSPYDGVTKGYLSVGIDEYGSFGNKGDNTATGNSSQFAGAIGVRGAGDVSWASLAANYPAYYPSTTTAANKLAAVLNTCKNGYLWNYNNYVTSSSTSCSGFGNKNCTTTTTSTFTPVQTTTAASDYPMLVFPTAFTGTISNQQITSSSVVPLRGKAYPITYSLKVTSDNLLSLSYSYNGGATVAVIASKDITTGNATLPTSFLFGFSAGTGAGSNVHEITCFKAAAINTASNSAGTNATQSQKVTTGTQVYLSYYHPLNSWGQLLATSLTADTTNLVTLASAANWDANCVLTGGACSATGASTTAQDPTARTIFSWNGTTSAASIFTYAGLSATQRTALGATSATAAPVLDYLRGVRTKEVTSGGAYRNRDSVLGDIRGSSPTWVGPPSSSYSTAGYDLLTKTLVPEFGSVYSAFITTNATRQHVVYNGSNDGMMHGFRAGAYNASGTYVSTTNDGQEVIAYMPDAAITSIHSLTSTALDFASPSYGHNYFVDATPGTGDLFYASAWHTWLVGGMAAGGNPAGATADTVGTSTTPSSDNGVLFALDITTPANFTTALVTPSSVVLGEWNSSNLVCSTDTSSSTCKGNLGAQYGTPIIRRLHDGNWAVIFGNGRNSVNGAAGIFIMTVNYTTGAKTFRYIDTNTSSTTTKNGIDFVTSADLDNDHVTDYIYAGDKLGNVWRFDLTSTTPANWAATKLFASGLPISTRVTVSSVVQASGSPRVLINFGTGRATPQTLTAAISYATGSHYMYGVWDWNMAAWNASSSVNYASLTAPQTIAASNLQAQTLTTVVAGSGTITSYRTETSNAVCWSGSTYCSSGNTQFGWKMALPGTNEQLIYNPVVVNGILYFNTYIPGVDSVISCTTTTASGYTMAVAPETGGALTASAFTTAAAASGITSTAVIVGIGASATGTPSFVTAGSNTFLVQQTVSGTGVVIQVDQVAAVKGSRVTWVKLR